MSRILSQNKRILAHLKSGKTITQKQAVPLFGCYRLSARIADLRDDGHPIRTDIIRNGRSHFAEYSLEEEEDDVQV